MLQWDVNSRSRLKIINDELISLLGATSTSSDGSWLDLYNKWYKDNPYEFIIYLQDGFMEKPPKEILHFDPSDSSCVLFFNALSMEVFISKAFTNYTRQTLASVVDAIHPDKKLELIQHYFTFINNSDTIKAAATLLQNIAEESGVLQGTHPVDLVTAAYFLNETTEKYSVESIYLLFTYWRITSDQDYLTQMIASITKYVRIYFGDHFKDENMHLDWPIEQESLIQQLNILSRWFELICFHAKNYIDEYKKRRWFISVDNLVDDLSFPPFIPYFEMLKYKYLYPDVDKKTVAQKATYFHRYGVWIKTVDVLNITSQAASIIYGKSDDEILLLGVSRAALLELSDNLKKLKECFVGLLFSHKEFYYAMRQKYSFLILDTHEQNARQIDASVDNLILFTKGIINNDIDTLLQSKQKFIAKLSGFLSEDTEIILSECINKVIEKLKEEIRKLGIYSKLYETVTQDFKKYAQNLLAFPDIFCSLVSAEYLYDQYIIQKPPNEKFDYSCISILYYMALEDFVNKLLYTSYATNILNTNISCVRQNYNLYISDSKKFWDYKNQRYKTTCEIGNLGYLFKFVDQETEFSAFLKGLYQDINLTKLISYGNKLINVAPRRNEAAHGGKLVTYNDVLIDKQNVYNTINDYRGLIMELFSIVFPKETSA